MADLRKVHIQLNDTERPTATFVVGMHRSGTSLTADLLRQCGLWLGAETELHGATAHNANGHWENIAITEFNDLLLNELGGGWDNVPDGSSKNSEQFHTHRAAAAEIHATLARPAPWGWKDPRASLLMPFWLTLEPHARVVICLRHPLEVAQSLRERGLMSYILGLKLWRDYNKRLLDDVPREQRIVVHYEQFFTKPLPTLQRLVDFCGLKADQATLQHVVATIKPGLRHIRFSAEQLAKAAVAPEIIGLYARLCQEAGVAVAPTTTAVPNSHQLVDLQELQHVIFLKQWSWLIQAHTPPGARVAVVSKGDPELLEFTQRMPMHFPCDANGNYAGYHPADDTEALAQLVSASAMGAQFLAIPQTSRWWLDAYPQFAAVLRHFPIAVEHRNLGIIYRLEKE